MWMLYLVCISFLSYSLFSMRLMMIIAFIHKTFASQEFVLFRNNHCVLFDVHRNLSRWLIVVSLPPNISVLFSIYFVHFASMYFFVFREITFFVDFQAMRLQLKPNKCTAPHRTCTHNSHSHSLIDWFKFWMKMFIEENGHHWLAIVNTQWIDILQTLLKMNWKTTGKHSIYLSHTAIRTCAEWCSFFFIFISLFFFCYV